MAQNQVQNYGSKFSQIFNPNKNILLMQFFAIFREKCIAQLKLKIGDNHTFLKAWKCTGFFCENVKLKKILKEAFLVHSVF